MEGGLEPNTFDSWRHWRSTGKNGKKFSNTLPQGPQLRQDLMLKSFLWSLIRDNLL